MAYYLVLCKCGHVGRNYYMPIWFPVEAENGREAARIARSIPRCKHDHKDAILDCIKTDYEGFLAQIEENANDPYLQCRSRHEQDQIMPLIKHRLVVDTHVDERWCKPKYPRRKVNLLVQSKRLEYMF